jgi:hypothetical protein
MSRPSCLQRCLAVVSRCAGVLAVVALIDAGQCARGQAGAPSEVNETFAGGDFDRMRWTLKNVSVVLTKVDFSKGAMRLVVPPGPDKREIMGLDSRFGFEGDFDISVDYSIRSLPRPQKEWTNLSIFIMGPDGMAAMTRTNNSNSGEGYSMWFQPWEGSKAKGSAKNEPTQDKAGTLRLARLGKQLRYYAAARGKPQKEIGTVDFGDQPIETVGFQILAPALKSPIDVEYDNISIKADRFTKLVFVPPSGNGILLWFLSGLAVITLAGLIWWWIFRRGR